MPQRNSNGDLTKPNSIHEISNTDTSSINNQNTDSDDSQTGSNSKLTHFEKFKNLNKFLKEEFNELRHAVEDDIDRDDDYHNKKQKRLDNDSEPRSVVIERQGGLANHFVLLLLFLWYLFSAFTLYTNKYIVTNRKADPTLVGTSQMIVTSLCGFLQLKSTHWKRSDHRIAQTKAHRNHHFTIIFWRNMTIIGLLR